MARAGLTKSRLEHMHRVLSGYVERRDIPGLVALVSHHDDVHVEVLGDRSFGRSGPMRRDTIFRIASLTKVVAAVAAMILVEDCAVRLDDSIEQWLPELANRRVLKSLASSPDDTLPARRAITVRDVLTYTMGFGSIMAPPGTYPIQRLIRDYRIGGDVPMVPADYPPTDEWVKRLGSLPWLEQPGERWRYQVSGDVLGVLIARVTGRSLGDFMRERIFEPLGMRDTAFHVPPAKVERLPTFYWFNRETNTMDIYDDVTTTAWRTEPAFEPAGGGLVSTIDDYFVFSQMLLNRGRVGNARILSRAAVELMTADHLTSDQRTGADIFFGTSGSWGLGLGVDIRRDEIFRTPGRFGWDGGFGTSGHIDPLEGLIGILFTQRMVDSPDAPKLYNDFWTVAYGAMA